MDSSPPVCVFSRFFVVAFFFVLREVSGWMGGWIAGLVNTVGEWVGGGSVSG